MTGTDGSEGDSAAGCNLIEAVGWVGGQRLMPKPYSSDLRQRAIALVEAGQSRAAVGRLFDIGKSTLILWVKDYRGTGKQAALPMGGRRRFVLVSERDCCWRGSQPHQT